MRIPQPVEFTVADLIAHLATLPQDAKVGVRGGFGGFRPLDEIAPIELVTLYGEDETDRLTLATADPIAQKWMAQESRAGEPFTAIILD
ncbi:hypothetical protein CcrSwift_gp234 [Caulobacter phage CcrSwift]|uniref:Uncharacterized protein n=1 Tax=Caulobacter phage CcrSwift TaxID=2927984 RepID=K4K7D7_9CAUD|nr:hypothetical protein D870_gp187 [Caulobacter phage CcrSwift]AFU88552.1 hypothetical protein CcrSwift_gp234 [Caulobacter phage CcrSwift]